MKIILAALAVIHFGSVVTFTDFFFGSCKGKVVGKRMYPGGNIDMPGVTMMAVYDIDAVCVTGYEGQLHVKEKDLKVVEEPKERK